MTWPLGLLLFIALSFLYILCSFFFRAAAIIASRATLAICVPPIVSLLFLCRDKGTRVVFARLPRLWKLLHLGQAGVSLESLLIGLIYFK